MSEAFAQSAATFALMAHQYLTDRQTGVLDSLHMTALEVLEEHGLVDCSEYGLRGGVWTDRWHASHRLDLSANGLRSSGPRVFRRGAYGVRSNAGLVLAQTTPAIGRDNHATPMVSRLPKSHCSHPF